MGAGRFVFRFATSRAMLARFTQSEIKAKGSTIMKMKVYTDAQIQRHCQLSILGTLVWIVGWAKLFMMLAGL